MKKIANNLPRLYIFQNRRHAVAARNELGGGGVLVLGFVTCNT